MWKIAGLPDEIHSPSPVAVCEPRNRSSEYRAIEVDDLTAKYIGAFGAKHIKTPNIDALAKEGVTFDHAVVQGCMCAPSRSSLIRARYPHNLGLFSNGDIRQMPAGTWAFPKALKQAGYHTSWIGKSHLLPYTEDQKGQAGEKKTGAMRERLGFDEVWQSAGRHVALKKAKAWKPGLDAYADYLKKKGLLDQFVADGSKATTLAVDDYLDGHIAKRTVDWLRGYHDEKPFFLWVNFSGPHGPYNPPAEWLSRYTPEQMPKPVIDRDHTDIPQVLRPHLWTKGEERMLTQRVEYAGMISFIDEQVGRVIRELDKDTVVVFFSDHGIMEGDHGLFHKETLYKEVLNPALIIKDPAGRKGARIGRAVELLDLARTAMDLAGCTPEQQQPAYGESLKPLLRGEKGYSRKFAVAEIRGATALVTRLHKYIETNDGPVLFDLQADPDEKANVAAANADLCTKLQADLDTWRTSHTERPNVLFLAVDDLRPSLGCYGDNVAITPNIDRIARGGTVFRNAHCQWPVCGPSRASLMTSLRPEATGVMDLKTDMRARNPQVLSLPQHFRQHGYETAGSGKIYDPRCVDDKFVQDAPSWSLPYAKLNYGKIKLKDIKEVLLAPDVEDAATADGQIAQNGLTLMRKLAKADKPFFLAVGFKKPHLPFVAPKRYWDLYDPDKIPQPAYRGGIENDSGFLLHDSPEFRGYGGVPEKGPIPHELQVRSRHGYYACTSFIDAQVGLLLDELDALGIADNTIVVLWGDHGFHLGDHDMWGKHSTLEAATRSPLIIRPVRSKAISKTDTPVELTDIFPTLCDMAGLPIPAEIHGRSLAGTVAGRQSGVRKGALTVFKKKGQMGYSHRGERYRYTEWINKFGKPVGIDLFDYQADPHEANSSAKSASPELLEKLAAALREEADGCERLK